MARIMNWPNSAKAATIGVAISAILLTGSVIGISQPGVTLQPGDTITITCATGPTATPVPTPVSTPVPTAVPTPVPTAVPTPVATPAPTPGVGVPVIPAQYGTQFRWVGTSGNIGPFQVTTWPDDHIGGSGQWMTVFNRFRPGTPQISVHDGYMDLRAVRPASGNIWQSSFVATSFQNNGPTFGYGVYRFWARFNIGPGTWQSLWLYDTTNWSATEIDFPEMLENQQLTAHVLGQGAGGRYGLPIPANLATTFHEFKIERRASFIAFSIDGVEVARINGSMPASKLAIMMDSKVGFGWTGPSGQITSATPNIVFIHIAGVTVDP